MKTRTIVVLLLSSFYLQVYAQKLNKVNFTINFGSAYNFPTYLKIHQKGNDDIIIRNAQYRTEAFIRPTYWDYKIDFETQNHFYGIRTTHHKLVLENTPENVESFEITHGYNLLIAYYGWKFKYFDLLTGGGIAFSHPQGIVNGSYIGTDTGIPLIGGVYKVTAPNIELGVLKKIYVYKRLFANIEGRVSAGYTKAKIIDGYVETWPISLHGNFGIGFDFVKKDE